MKLPWKTMETNQKPWKTRMEWESAHFSWHMRGHNWPFRCLDIYFDAAHHDQKYQKLWRLFLFVLTLQIHQIHFDQDQKYEMFGRPCICLYLNMTNTQSTFRSSSSRSKVSDVVTSGLVGHTVGIQKASSSQRIPTPQTILFLLLFFFKIWILFFFRGAPQQILMQQTILFSQSDLHLLHWEVYEFNTKDS